MTRQVFAWLAFVVMVAAVVTAEVGTVSVAVADFTPSGWHVDMTVQATTTGAVNPASNDAMALFGQLYFPYPWSTAAPSFVSAYDATIVYRGTAGSPWTPSTTFSLTAPDAPGGTDPETGTWSLWAMAKFWSPAHQAYSYAYGGNPGALVELPAGDPVPPDGPVVGRYPLGVYRVAETGGSRLFVGEGFALRILDASDLNTLPRLGSVNLAGVVNGITVSGGYVYVANGLKGLRIVLTILPDMAFETGGVDTPGYAYDVALSGHYAFVADGSGGLRVIDVSSPYTPSEVTSLSLPCSANRITVNNGLAAVVSGSCGVHFVDVSSPTSPTLLGTFDNGDLAYDVALDVASRAEGDRAYVATAGSHAFYEVDISDPSSPIELSSVDLPDGNSAHAVEVVGDTAYVLALPDVIHLISIAAGSPPSVVGSVPGVDADDLTASTSGLFAVGSALTAFDISTPSQPQLRGSLSSAGAGFTGYATDDGILVRVGSASGAAGMQVFNVGEPLTPARRGTYPDAAGTVSLVGKMALATANGGFRVVDVWDPQHPTELGSAALGQQGLAVSGGYAFVTNETVAESGLYIYDLSDPTAPGLVGSTTWSGGSFKVAVSGNLAFVTAGAEGVLRVVDVSDPTDPFLLGSVAVPGSATTVVAAEGPLALVAGHDDNIWTVDASSPAAPQLLAPLGIGDPAAVKLSGGLAVVTDCSARIHFVDVTAPASPRTLTSHLLEDQGTQTGVGTCVSDSLALDGRFVYVPDGRAGFAVIDTAGVNLGEIFSDDFELGGTDNWSATTP